MPIARLPPTSSFKGNDEARPYFLWWTDVSVSEFRERLGDPDRSKRAYWTGALLREANTRDVWSFVTPTELRDLWPDLLRHLGRRRDLWAFLLGFPAPCWPPAESRLG